MALQSTSQSKRKQPCTSSEVCCSHTDCKTLTQSSPFCPLHLALKYGVEVKESSLPNAGKGLFSTGHFKRNQRITPYDGERFSTPMWGDYVLEYKSGCFIDCAWSATCCAGRFVNDARDSKKTNCKFVYDSKEDRVWIVAAKHIHPKQELYLSYGSHSYWKLKERCEICSSSNQELSPDGVCTECASEVDIDEQTIADNQVAAAIKLKLSNRVMYKAKRAN